MAVLSFSPPPSGPPSKRLRIGSMQMMSTGASAKRVADGARPPARTPSVVEQHPQLRRGDEGVARGGDDRRVERDLPQPLAQVVVLDLGLQVEDPQRPRRGEAEERHAGGHVHEPG